MLFGSWPLLILLANSGSRCRWCHEGLEAGLSGLGWALAGQPHPHPDIVHRRGGQDMLAMGFRRAPIAGPSAAKGSHGLGDGPLNARALGILRLVRFRLFPLPGRLSAQILVLRSHGDHPPLGTGTGKATHAGLAITLRAFHLDDLVVQAISGGRPTETLLPHRTGGLLLFPTDHEVARIKALTCLRLPCVIRSCGASQLYTGVALAGDQQVCIQGAGIDHMEPWQQLFRL